METARFLATWAVLWAGMAAFFAAVLFLQCQRVGPLFPLLAIPCVIALVATVGITKSELCEKAGGEVHHSLCFRDGLLIQPEGD